MTNEDLIKALQKLPPKSQVLIHYDGALRLPAQTAWLTRADTIGIGSLEEPIYELEDRIADTTHDTNRYLEIWEMLSLPEPLGGEDLELGKSYYDREGTRITITSPVVYPTERYQLGFRYAGRPESSEDVRYYSEEGHINPYEGDNHPQDLAYKVKE